MPCWRCRTTIADHHTTRAQRSMQFEAVQLDFRTNKYIDETAPWVLAKDEAL